jgi:hypothetical protein
LFQSALLISLAMAFANLIDSGIRVQSLKVNNLALCQIHFQAHRARANADSHGLYSPRLRQLRRGSPSLKESRPSKRVVLSMRISLEWRRREELDVEQIKMNESLNDERVAAADYFNE